MFIELAEFLRCPAAHEAHSYCVLVPAEVTNRDVRTGFVGCPVCKREYPIVDGVVHFEAEAGEPRANTAPDAASLPAPGALQAALGLTGPGGYVVLLGSAALAARSLGSVLAGVHLVTVNAPLAGQAAGASALRADDCIPLRSSMARGIVVGADQVSGLWLTESERVLLRGLRIVVLSAEPPAGGVDGVEPLASGLGMWVGVKR